jgi:hypothetical protein
MCRLSWNLGASTSWNAQGLSRPVMGLLYLCPYLFTISNKLGYKRFVVLRAMTVATCLVVTVTLRPDSCYVYCVFLGVNLGVLCFWEIVMLLRFSKLLSRYVFAYMYHVPGVVTFRLLYCDILSRNLYYVCCRWSTVPVWFQPAAGNSCESSFRVSSVPRSRVLHHSICR